MKKIAMIALAVIALAMPVTAEVQTYEDDYVSFQYDDSIVGFIDRFSYKGNLIYEFESDGLYCNYVVQKNPDSIKNTKEAMNEPSDITTLLEVGDDVASFVRGDPNGECAFLQLLIESAKVVDGCIVDPDADLSKTIYRHYPYSEQALNYVRKAIEICNGYLELSIDKYEAADQIRDIDDRAKAYSESTGDTGDKDVASILFLSSSDFTFGDDAGVIEMRDELQTVLDGAF